VAPRQPRLSPQQRREQLLDEASRLIVECGLSACSLEEVGRQAGVSKALVYKYFATRDVLIKALVAREYEVLRTISAWMRPESTFAQALGQSNQDDFRYLQARGAILREILADGPTGRALGRGDREERVRRTWYIAEKVAKTYGVSPRVALMGTLITANVPAVAAGVLQRHGFTAEEAARFWTVFVLGGWAAASARYGDRTFSK
jgi:TetR/AcrR family transcriptional regulator, fatty acid biosynthesis regulator